MATLAIRRRHKADLRKLGDLMRDARVSAGLTQEDAAARMLFHRTALSKMEAGTQEIPIEAFLEMIELYELDLDTLLVEWGWERSPRR